MKSKTLRIWLVGFVMEHGGEHCGLWLRMLMTDGEERVRTAANAALAAIAEIEPTNSTARANNPVVPADE